MNTNILRFTLFMLLSNTILVAADAPPTDASADSGGATAGAASTDASDATKRNEPGKTSRNSRRHPNAIYNGVPRGPKSTGGPSAPETYTSEKLLNR